MNEQRCWDKWLASEKDPEAILRAKKLYEAYGKSKGYLKAFTEEELKVYKQFCADQWFLKGKRFRVLSYPEIRYILKTRPKRDSIEVVIFNKVMAYHKVCTYKWALS